MSLYQLQKLIYHVNRDAAQRESYRRNPAAFVKSYELSEQESAAVLNVDVRALYTSAFTPCCSGHLPCSTKFPTRIMPKH